MSELDFMEKAEPGSVFALLADDTRVEILQTIWNADGDELSFSALRDAVGMRDSGQFNYHLDKLRDQFVTKTDTGYQLTQAGKQINGAIEAGAYTGTTPMEPITLDGSCQNCGGTLELTYEDETVHVECMNCPVGFHYAVPPSVFVGCDRSEIPDVADRYLRSTFYHTVQGFCPYCEGRAEPSIGPLPEMSDTNDLPPDEIDVDPEDIPIVRYDCTRCGSNVTTVVDFVLLHHPAVVGFYYDHGIDLEAVPFWDHSVMSTDRVKIRSEEPFRAETTYTVDQDELVLVVDANLDVVDIES